MKRKIWVLVLVVGLCVLFAGIIIFTDSFGGMTLGLMGNVEQASIMNVRFVEDAPTGDTMKVTVRNSGATNVSIVSGYANGIKATNINSGQAFVILKATSLRSNFDISKRNICLWESTSSDAINHQGK